MIKKWNAVCSWMLTLFLLGHMLTMSIPVLTGGQDYSDCQILAGGIVATVLIHVELEINYAENQWNCYTDFIVSTHESTSSYNKWSNIFWWSKVSCISDGDSLCRCGISASECIVQPFYADAWFVEER